MAFTVPNAKNYQSPLIAVPLDWTSPPVEGPKGIQCTIVWSDDLTGVNRSVLLNLQNNATLNFSKVRALVFDNSANGSDVQVIFPDTETTVSIPAYTPYAVVPVFTNQTQFYVVSPNALATDKTSFMILNTLPPPIAVPTTQEQNNAGIAGIDVKVSGTTPLIAAGINGTLENVLLKGDLLGSGTGGQVIVTLVDGSGKVLLESFAAINAGGFTNVDYASLSDLRMRFVNGLNVVWVTTLAPTGAGLSASVYFRTP